ncbi:MAG: substrate-binding periplasmic protein [Spirochaetales bacterium]
MKKCLILLSIVLIALPLFATGTTEQESTEDTSALERTPDDPRLYNPGKLTVATGEPVFPPWMLDDDPAGGEGFENGLVYALAEQLGFDREDVEWVRVTFDQGIAPGPKPYDFNIQQYSITQAREEFVDFSVPYYEPDKAVVALPESGISAARTFADLREARWGATIGTTDLDYIENVLGVEDVAVFDDQIGTFQAMLADQIDATVISLPTALFATAVQIPEATIAAILPRDPNDRGFGLVFEEENPIVEWINEGLQAVIDAGIVEELTQEYLVGSDDIPEILE